MKKAFLKLGKVLLLFVFAVGIFNLFNAVQVVAARGSEHNLSLEKCPSENEDQLDEFMSEVNHLLTEAFKTSGFVMSNEEAAQRYLGLATMLQGTSYPECAQALYDALNTSFTYEAEAYAALAQGNILSHLRYWYYRSISVKGLYLVPFIIRMIEPFHPLPGQYHA